MERPATAPLASITSIRASTAPSQNVRVVTRIRPLSPKEISEQSQECISSTSAVINVLNEDKHFEFDSVFGPLATQEEVYKGTAGSMIQDSIYKGFNGTILAYGQTGSGECCVSLWDVCFILHSLHKYCTNSSFTFILLLLF